MPLTLLAKGEPIPGQDVAILKAGVGDWDPVDRSICLGLGDSEDVLPQARVQAMGFPSVAFDPQMMQPEAQYRVNAQEGQIANTVPMLGGWSAFEMTADINHGDSGGPVLDAKGRVIAINVGGSASRHTLAVPIDLAKRMLRDLHVTPDPGPATALWIEAVAAYAKGEYDAAGMKIEAICELQAGDRDPQGHLSPLASGIKMMLSEKVNPYVAEMRGRIYGKTQQVIRTVSGQLLATRIEARGARGRAGPGERAARLHRRSGPHPGGAREDRESPPPGSSPVGDAARGRRAAPR